IRKFPGAKRRMIADVDSNLANVKDDELEAALLLLAQDKGVKAERIERLEMLLKFLRNAYARMGLGKGASEYHSFHHSLEVSYMALHMLPKSFQYYSFEPLDFEVMLVAALLHDYDPEQATFTTGRPNERKGPSVVRTMKELERTRIVDAYFTLKLQDFERYFQDYTSRSTQEYTTTNPEMVNVDSRPVEAVLVDLLIWRTDFPFQKQELAKERFATILTQLAARGLDPDRTKMLAEILWLADLAVTYMGSNPVRAWDRVTNLYEELDLPKIDAVNKTDEFFEAFRNNETFQQIIKMRHFPAVFRNRWLRIFNFFHEGNPSTEINRTIENARKLYNKVNIEFGLRRGAMLEAIATEHFFEYFIGIGRDQSEVFKAKSRFSELDPQNASAFWGDMEKLLPSITDRSVDNILMVMPENSAPFLSEGQRETFKRMLAAARKKLVIGGSIRILTDIQRNNPLIAELENVADAAGFVVSYDSGKRYFPEDWVDPDFAPARVPQLIVLLPK
ncbi:MAG TPA: HD domain-containing protein, partial [Nitrososphaera sp.]|nr:HD domain-containing protein [Nitrososphaera sp.]